MIEYWIDIPNLQTVYLPDSFQKVKSKSITSICMSMNEWIDVSTILAKKVKTKDEVSKTNSSGYDAHSTTSRNRNCCTIFLYFCCK